MTSWFDLVGRARGLSTDMLGCDRIRAMARCTDLSEIVAALREADYDVPLEIEHDPRALEHRVSRIAGERLSLLSRWADARTPLLFTLMEDEDRRSLRALVRGILGGTPVDARTSSLIPTAALTASALEELASPRAVSGVASLLTAWGSAYGPAIAREAERQAPDPLVLQNAIDHTYFVHASRAARKVGDPLRFHVRFLIDFENASMALACAGAPLDRDPETLFIDGGQRVTRERFLAMLDQPTPTRALTDLLQCVDDGLLCRALTARHPWWNSEDAGLAALLAHYGKVARAHPLGHETVIQYALRLRAEVKDLSRVIWGVQLDVPREQLVAELVSC